MTSYVFSVIDKRINWDKVFNLLDSKYGADFEILFAVRASNPEVEYLKDLEKKLEDFFVYVYEDKFSENEMLGQTIKKANGDELILVRDYFEYTTILSDVLVSAGRKGVPLAMYRKPKKSNRLKDFFKKIYDKLVQFIFGFSLYEGDVGLMYFGNIPFAILKEVPNNILLTKINRWSGFEVSYVEIDDLAKPKLEKQEKKKLLKAIVIFASITALMLGVFITFTVLKLLGFLLSFVLIVAILLLGCWLDYLIIKLMIIDKIGDLN